MVASSFRLRSLGRGAGHFAAVMVVVVLFGAASGAHAQVLPWDTFSDSPVSASICDVVNADNAELVVLRNTGQLVIVTGRDTILEDSLVTDEGEVLVNGQQAGFLGFETDGDGLRTLWWTSLTGRVVSVDEFTGEPTTTNRIPADYRSVPCDACDLWDDPTVCAAPPPRPVVIRICGNNVVVGMIMTLGGLMMLGVVRGNGECRRANARKRHEGTKPRRHEE